MIKECVICDKCGGLVRILDSNEIYKGEHKCTHCKSRENSGQGWISDPPVKVRFGEVISS